MLTVKMYKGVVTEDTDFTQSFTIWATVPELGEGSRAVTYVSPFSNVDAGMVALPTINSEILVYELDGGLDKGLYYAGSIVGETTFLDVDSSKVDPSDPTKAQGSSQEGEIDYTTLGRTNKSPMNVPPQAELGVDGKRFTNEKIVLEDNGGNAIILSNQSEPTPGSGFQNTYTKLRSGKGKQITLNDSPKQSSIRFEVDSSDDKKNYFYFAGKQPEDDLSTTMSEGEMKLETQGPVNFITKKSNVEVRVVDGRNIDIKNTATGTMSSESSGRRLVGVGGGDPYPILPDGEEVEGANSDLPYPSDYGLGQSHIDENPPGLGGNPLDKGYEDWGCVNITSEYNNINLEAFGDDSVIHINAPGENTKIVVTTAGTVDILAKQKISLTSDEKIELNAPYVDINSTERVDID